MSDYTNSGTADIDQVLAQNAFVIGEQIYANVLNISRWVSVIPKSPLPIGMGDNLTSLIYDKSIPTTTAGGSTLGLNWTRVGTEITSAQQLNSSVENQPNHYAANETIGSTAAQGYVKWTKKLRSYFLEIARVRSPYVDVHDLRSAANMAKQVTAITDALGSATKWAWERRYQESYEKLCANLVSCRSAGSVIRSTVDNKTGAGTANDAFYGLGLFDIDLRTSGASNANIVPDAFLTNTVMDRLYNRLEILTPLNEAYGVENGKPIFCVMISSDASNKLKTESGFREDMRKSSRVDELLKPLGVDAAFRGFYHMCEPDMPRFNIVDGVPTRVEPLTVTGEYNDDYDTATHEAAYVVHKTVMEAQIPPPNVSAPGFKFDPVSYSGDFNWLNIKDEVKNPLGTIGFFMGTLASANLPKHVERGYVILFQRTSTTPAT